MGAEAAGALGAGQRRALERLKAGEDPAGIAVRDGAGALLARLVPITAPMASDPALLADLCRWRAANMSSFLTVFEPSVDKTEAYIVRFSLPDPARILFLIQDAAGARVGNIGLCNVTTDEAELDNVVRGEPVPAAGFMRWVQWGLAEWAFDTLGLRRVYLNVLADNDRAVRSYERAGFDAVGRQSLIREPIPGGYRLVPAEGGQDATLVRMEIDRAGLERARAAVI